MNKETKIIVAFLTIILLVCGVTLALTVITAPEHVIGTPIDPAPTPTPTPTAQPAELHFTSNNTDPFYKGDYLEMTATLTPAQTNITVTLYNNGYVITTEQTDASGVAVFVRQPYNPFDYTASAEIP